MAEQKQSERKREQKRLTILRAAETAFTQNGFDGTSMREIAREAGITLSLASYYFGSKQDLFEQLIERRAGEVVAHRRDLLAQERSAAGTGPIPLDRLIWAYITPFIERAQSDDTGWRNYTLLISQIANSPQWAEVIARNYDETARIFLDELTRTLPDADPAELVQGLTFVVNAMTGITARNRRSDLLSDGQVRSADLTTTAQVLSRFLAGGFKELSPMASE